MSSVGISSETKANEDDTLINYRDRKLADILFNFLKYLQDHIFQKELKRNKITYISHRNIMDILEDPDHKNNIVVTNFIENIGFNAKDLLYFYSLDLDRAGIYFIYRKNYLDTDYMLKQIDLFESIVNELNEKNILFNCKSNLKQLINSLKKYLDVHEN